VREVAPGIFRIIEQDLLLRAVLLEPGVAGVPDDLEQPGSRVLQPETRHVAHRPHERVLDDILRIVGVARDPKRQVVCRVEVRHRQLLEPSPVVVIAHVWSPRQARPGTIAIYSNPFVAPGYWLTPRNSCGFCPVWMEVRSSNQPRRRNVRLVIA